MNVFERLMFCFMVILFPLFCYLVYTIVCTKIDEKSKEVALKFALMNSFYLVIKYIFEMNYFYGLLLASIPIYITMLKDYKLFYHIAIIILVIFNLNTLYIIYPISFFILNYFFNKKNKNYLFILFVIISLVPIEIYLGNYKNIYLVLFYIFIFICAYHTIHKGEQVINYHSEFNRLKNEKALRESLFKITHEIKNPVAVIKAYLDMFNPEDIESSKRYIKTMSNEVDKLLILLQDFMLVNKDNINFDIMDVNMLIEDITDSLKELNNLNIIYDNDEEEIYINGDYNRLTQVFTNLIKNSFEANANNVVIETNINNKNIEINIIDNGDGISNDTMKQIYKPFYTTKINGTGLGVPLSKEIIEAHNGTLEYINNEKKGTITRVVIPLLEY